VFFYTAAVLHASSLSRNHFIFSTNGILFKV